MSYVTDSFDSRVVKLLSAGGVGLLPSDTIYGLSCRAPDQKAVERVHQIKRRDKTKPFVILISRVEQLNELGIITTEAAPALRYWPGKLTMICEAQDAPAWLHMGTRSLAVRQPDYPELRELIDKVGPIVSTSANLSGGQPAASVSDAQKYFGDKLDFYVDAGQLSGQPSTIIRKNNYELEVVRQGAVKVKEAK
ncbi:MAG TPA: L-threonylcarbamoyladenylate synthase [Candidatus Saccharimonadales bacterium]|nr:L-threonylcarbamoyladenylate synthase [Candidatus Saccharimonadales bacterium]